LRKEESWTEDSRILVGKGFPSSREVRNSLTKNVDSMPKATMSTTHERQRTKKGRGEAKTDQVSGGRSQRKNGIPERRSWGSGDVRRKRGKRGGLGIQRKKKGEATQGGESQGKGRPAYSPTAELHNRSQERKEA